MRLIRDRGMEVCVEIVYLSLHCHHQNDSCIKMRSDESHFNVLLIVVRDKVTKQCPQTTTFEEKGEPKRIRTEVLPLTTLGLFNREFRTGFRRIGQVPESRLSMTLNSAVRQGGAWYCQRRCGNGRASQGSRLAVLHLTSTE